MSVTYSSNAAKQISFNICPETRKLIHLSDWLQKQYINKVPIFNVYYSIQMMLKCTMMQR